LVVSGGMSWWKDFICVACYNIVGQRDEVSFIVLFYKYHRTEWLSSYGSWIDNCLCNLCLSPL